MPESEGADGADRKGLAPAAALTALGIVYGDLGTSPLYTMQTILGSLHGMSAADSALGVLSLVVWTLIVTVSLKYCLLVMRADNHGEGGILALMSLVGMNDWKRGAFLGASAGLLGAALIYGDGVITPSISVLSALEGVNVATTALKPFVLPLALAILVGLFAAQRFGTGAIGRAFGPVMLTWFVVIGLLGLLQAVHRPEVLRALDPMYGLRLLLKSGPVAPAVLGGVFLCATGGEALYADMGHVGRFPIRLAWYLVVLPSLVLSYAGQAALVMAGGAAKGGNPFFLLAPGWALIPLVCLATVATIIASQAIITGSFSMTRQAMQLGWLPPFDVRQTSDREYGQIFVPGVNLMMAVGTVLVTLAFRSSDRLAGAYGTAVSTTMVLTTLLLFRAMHRVWRWPLWIVAPVAAAFLTVDVGFFAANLAKVADGGWVPLSLGGAIYVVMITWRTGLMQLRAKLKDLAETPEAFLKELEQTRIARVPGTAVFLTRDADQIPAYVAEYVRNMGSLHETVLALNIRFEERPRTEGDRCKVERIADGFSRVTLRYGFMEQPDIPSDLAAIKTLPGAVDLEHAVFFGTRDLVAPRRHHSTFARLRYELFAYLYRNAVRVTDRFNLPIERTVEVARQVPL